MGGKGEGKALFTVDNCVKELQESTTIYFIQGALIFLANPTPTKLSLQTWCYTTWNLFSPYTSSMCSVCSVTLHL